MLYEPTAWYSYSQFSHIFNSLSDTDEYEKILFQIDLWKARGRVPSAIHATYLLLSVIVSDQKGELNEANMRDLFAMTIIRTVNLLLDQEQDSLYAKSMLLMGKEANIPENIIKFRHRCSHGKIPDVQSLRIVCSEAFNYVYNKYWKTQYNLVVSRLNDDYHYTFLFFSIFLLSRSGIQLNAHPHSNKNFNLTSGSFKYRLKLKEPLKYGEKSKFVLQNLKRAISLLNNKSNLSLQRHLHLRGKKAHKRGNPALVSLYNGILKKLMNYCVHEDIFISVFVEFVFCNFAPTQSHMFLIMLFHTVSQYSFNFTLKLISHMLNFIFDITDIFTDVNSSERHSILRRANTCYKALMNCGNWTDNTHNFTDSDSHTSNFERYRNRVNEWLLMLLQYANCLKNKQYNTHHLDYLRLIRGLPYAEYDRMLNFEFTALSRILACVKLVLPLYILKFGNSTHKEQVNGWNMDKLSHLICMNEWIGSFKSRYKFGVVDGEIKRKIVSDFNNKSKELNNNINKILLPGTLWNSNECRIKETYPLNTRSNIQTHRKILSSFEKITTYNIFKNDNGDKKLSRVQTQMYNINRSLESAAIDKLRVQKKIFRAISYAMCIFRS